MDVSSVLKQVNHERSINGMPNLVLSSELNASAQQRADYLCSHPFTHDGWITAISDHYNYQQAGENLAEGYNTPESLVSAWVASPKHFKVMTDNYEYTGIGISHCNNTYVVEHFANPLQDGIAPDYIAGIALSVIFTIIIAFVLLYKHKT